MSNAGLQFLRQSETEPLLNVQKLNPRLYAHVPEMAAVQVSLSSTQLHRRSVVSLLSLEKQIWGF